MHARDEDDAARRDARRALLRFRLRARARRPAHLGADGRLDEDATLAAPFGARVAGRGHAAVRDGLGARTLIGIHRVSPTAHTGTTLYGIQAEREVRLVPWWSSHIGCRHRRSPGT